MGALVPVTAGDRLSVSLSILITISVYQILIAEQIPTVTKTTPVISGFLLGLIVLMTFQVLSTCLLLKIAQVTNPENETVKRPNFWARAILLNKFFCRTLLRDQTRDLKMTLSSNGSNPSEIRQSTQNVAKIEWNTKT